MADETITTHERRELILTQKNMKAIITMETGSQPKIKVINMKANSHIDLTGEGLIDLIQFLPNVLEPII